jgi:hypothetical protein
MEKKVRFSENLNMDRKFLKKLRGRICYFSEGEPSKTK